MRRRHAVAGDEHEAGLVAGVVGDVGGQHVQAVQLAGDARGDRRQPGPGLLADHARRLGRRVGRPQLGLGQRGAHVGVALRGGDRDRQHRLHVGERRARLGQQAVLDVEHHLALDQQIVAERQLVLGEVDRSLDRVLDGHEAEVDLAGLDGVEHVGHGAVQHVLGRSQIGLRLQRLLGERAERPEEADTSRGVNHVSQAIGTRSVHPSDMNGNTESPTARRSPA